MSDYLKVIPPHSFPTLTHLDLKLQREHVRASRLSLSHAKGFRLITFYVIEAALNSCHHFDAINI